MLGEAGGRTFEIGRNQVAPQQEGAGFQDSLQVEKNLLDTENSTSEYYTVVGNLKSFAKSMNDIGIDVTKADPTDPMSIKANNSYMKGLAYVQELGNRLQSQERDRGKYVDQMFTAQGANLQNYNEDPDQFVAGDVANTALSARTKGFNQEGSTFYDKGALKVKQERHAQLKGIYEQERDEATSKADKKKWQAQIDGLEAPKYDNSKDVAEYQRANPTGGEVRYDFTPLWDAAVKNAEHGVDVPLFQAVKGIDYAKYVVTSDRTGIELQYSGEKNPKFIDFRNKNAKLQFLNPLNMTQFGKVNKNGFNLNDTRGGTPLDLTGIQMFGETPTQGMPTVKGAEESIGFQALSNQIGDEKDNKALKSGTIDYLRTKMRTKDGLIMPVGSIDVGDGEMPVGSEFKVLAIRDNPRNYKWGKDEIEIKYAVPEGNGFEKKTMMFDLSDETHLVMLKDFLNFNELDFSNINDGTKDGAIRNKYISGELSKESETASMSYTEQLERDLKKAQKERE